MNRYSLRLRSSIYIIKKRFKEKISFRYQGETVNVMKSKYFDAAIKS